MVIELSEIQLNQLSESYIHFKKFTGSRWSFNSYVKFVIKDAIEAEVIAAKKSTSISQENLSMYVMSNRHAH